MANYAKEKFNTLLYCAEMSSMQFVAKPDDKYKCTVTAGGEHYLRPPVMQTQCGHRFCVDCMDKLKKTPEAVCSGKEQECVSLQRQNVSTKSKC